MLLLLVSRVVDTSKEATKLLQHKHCQSRDVGGERDLSFKFFLFGKKPPSVVSDLKRGMREAARDFSVRTFISLPFGAERAVIQVDVQFHHYLSSLNSTEEGICVQSQLRKCDGAAVAAGSASDVPLVNDFPFSSGNEHCL